MTRKIISRLARVARLRFREFRHFRSSTWRGMHLERNGIALPYQWSRRTFWRCTDTTTSPKKKQERRDRGKTRTREVTRLCQVHDGGREGGSSWNSYVARRKVVGNEVIIFSGKSRQLDRRGRERALVDTAKVDGKNAFDGRIFEVLTGPSADLHELRMNSSPDSFPPPSSAVSTSLPAFTFAKKLEPSSKVICSIPRRQTIRKTKRMTPVTIAINKSEKVRGVRFKDRIRQIDTWIFQKTCKRPDDGKFSLYKAVILKVKKDSRQHFRRLLKITENVVDCFRKVNLIQIIQLY